MVAETGGLQTIVQGPQEVHRWARWVSPGNSRAAGEGGPSKERGTAEEGTSQTLTEKRSDGVGGRWERVLGSVF